MHLVYHGLNADFARLVARARRPRPRRTARLRVLGVGRLVAKKGFDVFVDACAELRRRDVPFEALIVGQDDKHGDVVRERIAAPRPRRPRRAARPDGPGRAAARVPPRRRAVHAVPRARRTTATGSRTCSSRRWRPARRWSRPASPASPSWSSTRSTGCWSRPTTRRRSPTRSSACTRTASWPRALAEAGRAHRARALRRRPPRASGSPSCSRRRRAAVNARCSASSSTCTATARSPRTPRAGRFTCAGETRELGTEPDWLGADLPADEEWRIEWVKFYYGLDLAHAYRDDRRPALPRRLGAAGPLATCARCRPTATRARSPPAGSSTGSTPGSGFGALPNGLEPRARRAHRRRRRATCATTLDARAQPPHARAVRAADRRARASSRRRAAATSRSRSSTATWPTDFRPTACTASARRTTT